VFLSDNAISQEMNRFKIKQISAYINGKNGMGFFLRNGGSTN
jgi:hypothetical protein